MNRVMIVAGTRPEAIKLSPVIKQLKNEVDMIFVWSGQHYDYELSEVFFNELELPKPDLNLDIRSGSHGEQTAKVILGLEKAILRDSPSLVLAQGDTNTAVSAAITSVKCCKPFAHVEAGLRSYDRVMPEEMNRIIADSCSELLFAPTKLSVLNLNHEGIPIRKILLTGNTITDVVLEYKELAKKAALELLSEIDINSKNYILLTMHRQENTDDPIRLSSLIKAVLKLSLKYDLVFPIHPRTKKRLQELGLFASLQQNRRLKIISPLGYFDFLGLLSNCSAVLTDSGGVQEEAFLLGIPTITLRYNTERPETVLLGVNVLAGTNSDLVYGLTEYQLGRAGEIREISQRKPNPFGVGDAGVKIAIEIKSALGRGIRIEEKDTTDDPYLVHCLIEGDQIAKIDDSFEILAAYDRNGYSHISEEPIDLQLKKHRVLVRASATKLLRITSVE